MNKTDAIDIDDVRFELENRIRNLLWTVSGDYKLEMKPDVSLFQRSKAIALYDGVKQGALARYFDKDMIGLYLVKKIFLGAEEGSLTAVAQLCIEEAIGDKICEERPGIYDMQRKCYEDIIDQEYEKLPALNDIPGRFRLMVLRQRLMGEKSPVEKRLQPFMELINKACDCTDTMQLIEIVDHLYNNLIDPDFEREHGDLKKVMSVTMDDLTEFSWEDFLSEEMYEEALESYVQQMANTASGLEDREVTEKMDAKRQRQVKVKVVTPEMQQRAYSYVELNYGKTYLSENEEKRINYLMCRDVHSECSLYFTEGVLKNPVKRNYQYEYAKRLKNKNVWLYHDKHRVVKYNIALLTDTLRKSLTMRCETQNVLSDRGNIVPSRLWKIGRTKDARLFEQELKADAADFVVDVLIDASGSQMRRQGEVALQAYIISEALSNVNIPHRVMSFCTFWDYTIMHRFRKYDDPRSENENIFNYVTSSNNRDGLAIRTAGYDLMQRDEEKKIMIILSDGRPYDVIINRNNARNPKPYQGKVAIVDTATEVRRLRNQDVSVLGVFAGEEKDLATEKKIFGKDFAYIRDIANFSKIVGRYLTKQLEIEE